MNKIESLQSAVAEYFAPWVQELGLQVDGFDQDSVTLRLPQRPRPSRGGGRVCGQARVACSAARR